MTSDSEGQGPDRPQRLTVAIRFAAALCDFLLQQWLIIGFGIACVLAYFFPRMPLSIPHSTFLSKPCAL